MSRTRTAILRRCGLLLAAALLAACAALPGSEQPGALRADVLQRLGKPTATYALPDGGERLQYSELPAGHAVYNLDFDSAGRLRRVEQPLTPARLAQIQPGLWTLEDVRLLLGPPVMIEHVAMFDGDIYTYRFFDFNESRFIHIHIDRGGTVRLIQFTDEFIRSDRDSDG